MAFYIMQRLADGMHGEGERLFPKLVNGQAVDLERVAARIEGAAGFTRGDVIGVLTEFIDQVKATLAEGNSVSIEGLGTLRPVLGLVEKGRRGAWTDSAGRVTTGRNVRLKTVNFRPDKRLMRDVGGGMELVKLDDSAVSGARKVATTVGERASMARQYLAERGYMRVADYASLTRLSYSTAAKELRLLSEDASSGITSRGSGAGKIYVASKG